MSFHSKIRIKDSNYVDFSNTPIHEKLNGFFNFDEQTLFSLNRTFSFVFTASDYKTIKNVFKSTAPSIFELEIINSFLKSSTYLSRKKINKIEISYNNPHLKKALELYNEINISYQNEDYFRKTGGINNLAFMHLLKQNIDNINLSPSGVKSLKCKSFIENQKKYSFVTSFSCNSPNLNNCAQTTANFNSTVGSENLAININNLNPSVENIYTNELSKSLDISLFIDALNINNTNFQNLFNSFSVGISGDLDNPYDDFSPGDKILFIKTQESKVNIAKEFNRLLEDGLLKHFAVKAFPINEGLINGLINIDRGFELFLDKFPQIDLSVEKLIIDGSLDCFLLIINKNIHRQIFDFCSKRGFDCYDIGVITKKNSIKVYKDKTIFSFLDLYTFQSLEDQSSTYRIVNPLKIKVNNTEQSLSCLINQEVNLLQNSFTIVNYQPFKVGNILTPPFKGIKQIIKSSIKSIAPYYNKDGLVIGIASDEPSENQSDDIFTNTVNSVLSAVLKLVAQGFPFHQSVSSISILFHNSNNPIKQGFLLSSLLGILYVQLILSIPNIDLKINSSNVILENPIMLTQAISYSNNKIISDQFKIGQKLFFFPIRKDSLEIPDIKYLLKFTSAFNIQILSGNIVAAKYLSKNIFKTILELMIGDNLGFSYALTDKDILFTEQTSIIAAVNDIKEMENLDSIYLGVVDDTGVVKLGNDNVDLLELSNNILKDDLIAQAKILSIENQKNTSIKLFNRYLEFPEVLIISFDKFSAKVFKYASHKAGFRFNERLLNNYTKITDDFIKGLRTDILRAQIVVFAGENNSYDGFDGDFLYNILHKPAVLDALNELLFRNNGLIFCSAEGMRAIVKLGFIPYGNAEKLSIVLKANLINEPKAFLNRVRITCNNGPWLSHIKNGDVYSVPSPASSMQISKSKENEKIFFNNVVVAQYIDANGDLSISKRDNPTGSNLAIAAMCSPEGQVLGFVSPIEKTYFLMQENNDIIDKLFYSAKKYFTGNK